MLAWREAGQPGGCCSGPAERWEGLAWGRLRAARRKRLQREMCSHALLHPKGPDEELNSRVDIWPHVVQAFADHTDG